jgi:hypothetical protein
LLRLCQKRQKTAKKIKKHYSTIKAAEGTRRHARHKRLQAQIVCKKKKLLEKRMGKAIKEFFATVNTEDVNKQLKGILPSAEVLTPSKSFATFLDLYITNVMYGRNLIYKDIKLKVVGGVVVEKALTMNFFLSTDVLQSRPV